MQIAHIFSTASAILIPFLTSNALSRLLISEDLKHNRHNSIFVCLQIFCILHSEKLQEKQTKVKI